MLISYVWLFENGKAIPLVYKFKMEWIRKLGVLLLPRRNNLGPKLRESPIIKMDERPWWFGPRNIATNHALWSHATSVTSRLSLVGAHKHCSIGVWIFRRSRENKSVYTGFAFDPSSYPPLLIYSSFPIAIWFSGNVSHSSPPCSPFFFILK